MRFVNDLLQFVFPTLCSHCQENPIFSRLPLCDKCKSQFTLIDKRSRCLYCFCLSEGELICNRCHHEPPAFRAAASVFDAEGPPFSLLKSFKSGRQDLMKEIVSFYIVQLSRLNWPSFDFLIPVPAPFTFTSPVLRITKMLSKMTNVPYLQALKVQKPHFKQSFLPIQEREKLSSNTFTLKLNKCLTDKTLLLIDDLMVTRKTLQRCSEALSLGCPSHVYALTFCCYE